MNITREQKKKWQKKWAYYNAELNMIHPFREGNGRTIRLVIRDIARIKGYDWSFQNINQSTYIQAMIQSVVDESLLQVSIEKTLSEYDG